MEYIEYSYRYAKAIIESDKQLKERYHEFLNVLKNISDDDLSKDFTKRRVAHEQKKTNFKSITPSINYLLKKGLKKFQVGKLKLIFSMTKQITMLIQNGDWILLVKMLLL